MVAAFDYCLHGKGGAAPSIDTAMHGLVDAAHVDHLHPDSGIAIATAADGEELTEEIFGDKVAWVPWRRPGFQLGLDIAAIKDANPQAVGCILGGHGITAWGDTSRGGRGQLVVDHRHRRRLHRRAHHGGAVRPGPGRLRRAAGGGAARQGGRPGGDVAVDRVGGRADGRSLHRRRTGAGVPGLDRAPAAGGSGHLLPGSLPADQGEAAGAGPARRRERGGLDRPAEGAARGVPGRLPGLLRPQRRRRLAGHPRRGPGDHPGPRGGDVLVRQEQADRPGGRGVLPERDQRDARRRGPVHVRADRRGGEVPDRVLGAGGGEAGAAAEAEAAGRPDRAGHRRRLRASARPSPPGSPPRARAW